MHDKHSQKIGREENFLNLVKRIYKKPTAKIISVLNGERLNAFSLRLGTRMVWELQQRIKDIQIREEEIKLSLFVDDIIVFIENPKESKEKLERIHEFSKVAGYKKNIQNSIVFLNASSEHMDTKIKNIVPFTIAPKI